MRVNRAGNDARLATPDLIEAARQSAEHAFSQTYSYATADERPEEVRGNPAAGTLLAVQKPGMQYIGRTMLQH